MSGVLDQYGGVEGAVSLEDVVESIIGEKIVDEFDAATDLKADAWRRKLSRLRQGEDRT